MVNAANEDLLDQGMSGRADIAGANDIETGWNGPGVSRAWVRGYDSRARWPFYDFGDAGGCRANGRCVRSWTVEDVWYVSWGSRSAWPLPEIYTPNGSQARQWYRVSLYSTRRHHAAMTIVGALSQHAACRQSSDPCVGMNASPRRAWSLLHRLLNRDRRTLQTLPFSSDIRWAGRGP